MAARRRPKIATLENEQNFRVVSGRRGIAVFEGWDACGKGGSIQCLTATLNLHWFAVWLGDKGRPVRMK